MNANCIEYKGLRTLKGYGLVWVPSRKRVMRAHHWAWEAFNTEALAGRMVLHRCDNPSCINPLHLYAGTAADNSRDRAERQRDRGWARPACSKGHSFDSENTYIASDGRRYCKACRAEYARMLKRRKRQEASL